MTTTRLLDRRAVEVMTGLSRSAIYAAMTDGTFPKPIRIGTRGVRWFEHEVLDWIARRVCAGAPGRHTYDLITPAGVGLAQRRERRS